MRKAIYPASAFGVKVFRWANRHTLEIIGDKRIPTDRPVVFFVTHIGLYDIERVFEACKTPCWIFYGEPKTIVRAEDVFRPIANIQNITAQNVKDVLYAKELVKNDRRNRLAKAVLTN